jgi:transcriptional regulator with XRE-family HTH domain
MDFGEKLAKLRGDRGLSQSELADIAGVHLSQLGRYESGLSSPTLDVLRRLCVGLGVSAEQLLFDSDERGGSSLSFVAEAASVLDEEEQEIVAGVIDALLYKHQAEARRRSRAKPGRKPVKKAQKGRQKRA